MSSKQDRPTAISVEEALGLARATSGRALASLLDRADQTREAVFGTEVRLCSIVNAKAGGCSEDCAFCAQSRRLAGSPLQIPIQPLHSASRLTEAARWAERNGAFSFSIVTAGKQLAQGSEQREVENALTELQQTSRLRRCASLGLLGEPTLRRLRQAGLERYHCNLEAAPSFFSRVCTTHTFEEKLATLEAARRTGLSLCSGGIFGMGETFAQRVELADVLRRFEVDAVPVNFLDPRPGTPLADTVPLGPEECLATIAVVRLMLPGAELIVMGGREVQLRDMQSDIFRAGATGTIVGDYLTTPGTQVNDTIALIERRGLSVRRPAATGGAT
ncbi:MAG: biotin synthase BioB [Polyangiaceae bacterium]|nr:biotin synthase BioB [Polyangiaceae bacterium]